MNDPMQLVVFPRGQLSPSDKGRMTKHGILCIEADDPKDVRILSMQFVGAPHSDLLECALEALAFSASENNIGQITTAGRQKARFVTLLRDAVRNAKTTP